jgi:DNA-binding transcriptional LysR family regulator
MNIRFLETFVWLARLRNFRLTAERLHTTQAAVSSRIASLEQDFGVRLFDRSAREVALTADGSKALVYAERMVKLMREMKDDMSDREVFAGVIRIGVIESIVHSWFPDFLGRLHKAFPRLQIEIVSDTTIHLHEQFSKSNLDLVLQAEPVIGPQVSNIALCEFPMRWVGSPKLDIGSETLSLADLAAFPHHQLRPQFGAACGDRALVLGQRAWRAHAAHQLHRLGGHHDPAGHRRLRHHGRATGDHPARTQRREPAPAARGYRVPALALIACFRADHENPLTETVARIAQETASDFALNWGQEIARLPARSAEVARPPACTLACAPMSGRAWTAPS